ncbi:hypothetical protein BaRGS_00019977 [Batillaria attramentaria]|uniref:Uncharacterized protein n=1 Tax=Batillaria attramentaria TaxID=370345 RepID=A0ABD0KNY9_9CAEN
MVTTVVVTFLRATPKQSLKVKRRKRDGTSEGEGGGGRGESIRGTHTGVLSHDYYFSVDSVKDCFVPRTGLTLRVCVSSHRHRNTPYAEAQYCSWRLDLSGLDWNWNGTVLKRNSRQTLVRSSRLAPRQKQDHVILKMSSCALFYPAAVILAGLSVPSACFREADTILCRVFHSCRIYSAYPENRFVKFQSIRAAGDQTVWQGTCQCPFPSVSALTD